LRYHQQLCLIVVLFSELSEMYASQSVSLQLEEPGRHNSATEIYPIYSFGAVVVVGYDDALLWTEVDILRYQLTRDAGLAIGETEQRRHPARSGRRD
jgi:hypothetical protein